LAHIIRSQIIHKQSGRYVAWPMVARAANGELLIVFSGDREGHVCPYGKTFLLRSDDDGANWSQPELINNSPMDDRDAGLCVCADGTLIVSWFTTWRNPLDKTLSPEWLEHLHKIGDADIEQWTRGDLMDSG